MVLADADGQRLTRRSSIFQRERCRRWSGARRPGCACCTRLKRCIREALHGAPRADVTPEDTQVAYPVRAIRTQPSRFRFANASAPGRDRSGGAEEAAARREAALGEPVPRAVITVPAYFNDASVPPPNGGELAGSRRTDPHEPTAAALAYGLDRLTEQSRIAYMTSGAARSTSRSSS